MVTSIRTWMTHVLSSGTTVARRRPALLLELLETREVPAVTVQLDFSHDVNGFFNDQSRRAVLQQAVNDVASHLSANLTAITPTGGNTWAQTFYDPATGQQATVSNPSVAANTLVLYVGGREMSGSEAGVGGGGGYTAYGSQAWLSSLSARGPGFTLWGGSISFDASTNWWFGSSVSGIGANQVDFYSVAVHELGHVLGIGTASTWYSDVSGSQFVGSTAESLYGGPVPLSPDRAHWADGTTVNGQRTSLDPYLTLGARTTMSSLDYAGLQDVGWSISGVSGVPDSSGSFTPPPVSPSGGTPVVLTGPTDGSAQAYELGANNTLTAIGSRVYPFSGFNGVIRSTVADFNGDGVADYAFATGSGTAATIRIYDGKTGANLVPPTTVLDGFTGGVFLAAGEVNRDGQSIPILVVSADAGGGPRVVVYGVGNGGLTTLADFIAFNSPDFRGGARVALADINRDGSVDLIVGAGSGGGPRVSVFDGASLAGGRLTRLIPDFFALDPNMRSGVYVSAGDFDGDGYADIAYSTGMTGGPRIRVVSGAELLSHPGADVAGLPAMADFFALDPNDRDGIRITAHDMTGNGQAVLIVGSGNKSNATVRVIPFSQMNTPSTPLQDPFSSPETIDGVYVG